LERDPDGWVMAAVDPHVRIRLKQLFPRIDKTATPPYRFQDTPEIATDLEWFLSRYPMQIGDSDLHALRDRRRLFEENLAEIGRIMAPGYVPPALAGLRDGQSLRHYQVQLVELVRRSKRVLCADEGGLGKTYEAAGAFLLPGALPAVAICYPHLQNQWRSKIESFTNLRCHVVKTTRPYSLPDSADVVIFRWSQLIGWTDAWSVIQPRAIAFDECQELRTGMSAGRNRSAKVLADQAEFVLGLTATPIYNWGVEIYNGFEVISPGVLGARDEFFREWCGGGDRIQDPKALGTHLRDQHCFLRRTRQDVGQELPKCSRIVEFVDYDEDQMRSVDDMARYLAVRATTGEFTERGKAVRELDLLVRHATGVSKAKAVAQFIRILVEGGERVLVGGWHRDVYDIWMRELRDLEPCMYTGTESPTQKQREADRFITGNPKPMFMSLRSGAGLDGIQQHCSVVVIGELDWSPGVHQQFIWRIDREGQTQPVSVFFLVTDDGSDPPMMELNGLKASEASQIIDPHLGVTVVDADESRLMALARAYLSKQASKALPRKPAREQQQQETGLLL
jgi:hypothetical protein